MSGVYGLTSTSVQSLIENMPKKPLASMTLESLMALAEAQLIRACNILSDLRGKADMNDLYIAEYITGCKSAIGNLSHGLRVGYIILEKKMLVGRAFQPSSQPREEDAVQGRARGRAKLVSQRRPQRVAGLKAGERSQT